MLNQPAEARNLTQSRPEASARKLSEPKQTSSQLKRVKQAEAGCGELAAEGKQAEAN